MQPPGSWHRASEVAQAVGRRVEQVYNLLRHWDEQGVVTRKDTGRRYQYALKKKE
jgi:predicted transcriptional regulator